MASNSMSATEMTVQYLQMLLLQIHGTIRLGNIVNHADRGI